MRSMTGFGRGQARSERFQFEVSLRSVNHRFLDLSLRGREQVRELEGRIRTRIEKDVSRGRIELTVEVQDVAREVGTVEFNASILAGVVSLHEELSAAGADVAPLSLGDLQRIPGLLVVGELPSWNFEDEDTLALDRSLGEAVESLCAMRIAEGAAIEAALLRCVEQLEVLVEEVSSHRESIVEELHRRLLERLKKLMGEHIADPRQNLARGCGPRRQERCDRGNRTLGWSSECSAHDHRRRRRDGQKAGLSRSGDPSRDQHCWVEGPRPLSGSGGRRIKARM